MTTEPLRVAVIVGSTREGRFAPVVASWFASRAAARPDMTVDLVDLAEEALPERLGGFGAEPAASVTGLRPRLAAAQAFVVVTPEYNHSYPAAVKTLIDWYFDEWRAKPVGFVSYGARAGGVRAVEHLRPVFAEVHAMTIRDTISIAGARRQFGQDGAPSDGGELDDAAQALLDQLAWWALALAEARERRPYKV
jgi:NAD(P)H-dependent FMN reductase